MESCQCGEAADILEFSLFSDLSLEMAEYELEKTRRHHNQKTYAFRISSRAYTHRDKAGKGNTTNI